MALIQCRECGKQISDKAASCPGCGAPNASKEISLKTPSSSDSAANEPIELSNGKWSWGGMEFNSLEAANMFAASRQTAPTDTSPPAKFGLLGWALALGIAALIGSCVFGGSSKQSANKSTISTDISDSRALSLCKQAIRLVSRDPDKAEIPYASPSRSGPDYLFTWTPGINTIRLRNGLGLDVPASARCAVNAASGQISILDVNGNTIVH